MSVFHPVGLKHVHHKHGGQITSVTGIGHHLDKPSDGYSRDYWFFIGDVTWRDGGNSVGIEIAPWAVCYVDGEPRDEVDALMSALNKYLQAHGDWCERKSGHEGWYAHRPAVPAKPKRANGSRRSLRVSG